MFDWSAFFEGIRIILTAVPRTLLMSAGVLLIGIIVGGIMALLRMNRVPVLSQLVKIFVSYVRGVPLIVHLLVILYSIPDATASLLGLVGIEYDTYNFPSALLALLAYSLLESAVESENIRGAFQSVGNDQIDAARSIGMTRRQSLVRIIIPQALTVAIPLFLNAFIKIIRSLSLAFTVGFVDILAASNVAAALTFRNLESYFAAALVYWVICGLLDFFFSRLRIGYSMEERIS